MSAPLTGGCLCGRVRWIAEAPVLHRVHCHCSLCRRASGAVEVPWVTVARDGFRWTGAEPALYRSTASAERSFCPTCGSKITFVHDDLPDEVDIAVGSLDDVEQGYPLLQIHGESRVPVAQFVRKWLLDKEAWGGGRFEEIVVVFSGEDDKDISSEPASLKLDEVESDKVPLP